MTNNPLPGWTHKTTLYQRQYHGRWPRVPITFQPAPAGPSFEEINQAVMAVCRPLWAASLIPVIAWGSDFDGAELHPPARPN